MPSEKKTNRPNRLAIVLAACASVIAGVWTTFGELHQHHNGDSLVPILVSLQRWTFYYWEQDRFGMLTPLLAIAFKNPFHNLLAQNFLTATAGIAAIFLTSRYIVRDDSWLIVGSVAVTSFLLCASSNHRFQYLSTCQPYNVSLFLGVLALLFVPSESKNHWLTRLTLAGLFIFLASWVNAAICLLLLPFVVFRDILAERSLLFLVADISLQKKCWKEELARSHAAKACGLLVFAILISRLTQQLASYRTTWVVIPSPFDWFSLICQLITGIIDAQPTPYLWPLFLLFCFALGCVWNFMPRTRSNARMSACSLSAILLASLCYGIIMALLFKARERYLLPAYILINVGVIGFAFKPLFFLFSTIHWRNRVSIVGSLILILIALVWVNGLPSGQRVRFDLDRTLGKQTNDIINAHCTHIAGDYWKVWPTVFHVNMVLNDQGKDQIVWGISHRSLPTRHLWDTVPLSRLRIGVVQGDSQADHYLRVYRFPSMYKAFSTDKIVVLIPYDVPILSSRELLTKKNDP